MTMALHRGSASKREVVKCEVVGRLPLEHMQEGGLMHVVQIGEVVHVDGV